MKTETNDWKTILQWIIDEKPVQLKDDDGEWSDPDWSRTDAAYHLMMKSGEWWFRLKPRTITVNGREVQAGETVAPDGVFYAADAMSDDFYMRYRWHGDKCDMRLLNRGLVHLNKEAAIAHAKAMLNID